MNEQIKELLTSYQIAVAEIRNALRIANLSEREINAVIINWPEFDKMIPEDVLNIYKDFRKSIILYLDKLGFSSREIEYRLKGDSYSSIADILKSKEEVKRVSFDEVSK